MHSICTRIHDVRRGIISSDNEVGCSNELNVLSHYIGDDTFS